MSGARRRRLVSDNWNFQVTTALLHKSRPFFNEINGLANFADFDKPHEFNGLANYATTPTPSYLRYPSIFQVST